MSSFFKQKSKPPNKNSQIQPTFQKALNLINDNNQYDFAPSIQQYNFGSYEKRQSQQAKIPKIVNEQQSQIQPRVSFNVQPRQSQIIQKLNKKVKQLEAQNVQLKKDNLELTSKILQLQKKIQQLNKKLTAQSIVKSKSNQRLNDYQLQLHHSLSSKKSLTKKKLSKQNSLMMGSPSSSSQSLRQKTISTSPVLLKQLLLECNQSREFQQTKKSIKTNKTSNYLGSKSNSRSNGQSRDQFYQYKDTKDCFSPFYSNLARELQLRCKKAMLREKELIYRDDYIEMGCISRKTDTHQFSINLIITNLHNLPIKNVNIAYLYKNDIQLSKEVKSINLNVIKSTKDHTIYGQVNSAQQIKQNIQVLVQTVDFRCILVSLEFTDHRGQVHKIVQILPGCKHRLFSYLVPTPIPANFTSTQKVVVFDKKFLPDLDKLKSYYKNIHFTTDRHKNPQALLKIEFLSKSFFVTFKLIGTDKLAFGVYHLTDDIQIGQKVLNQLQFIFEK